MTYILALVSLNQVVQAQSIGFYKKTLNISGLANPTSLQFGKDGRLYVSEQNGLIKIFDIERTDEGGYSVTDEEIISLVYEMPNYDDDGILNESIIGRQVTGILLLGTPDSTVIFVTSSDPRIGGGGKADTNLDTNSGIISKIYRTPEGNWEKIDLVRGLPRSEENHSQNGLDYLMAENQLLVTSGGNTNQGAPSNNFTFIAEYAYSAALLSVDLSRLESMPVKTDPIGGQYVYDLPTLDDESRANETSEIGYQDTNDPFGGNNGKNQAMLTYDSPVQIYSSGWRNAYDVLVTDNGLIYTVDNGPNKGWGGPPINDCSNDINENSSESYPDNLHYVAYKGYYGGHPNPTRSNRLNHFNETNPQSPVEEGLEDPSCEYLIPGQADNALATYPESTNGLAQYVASNFDGGLIGDLITVAFDGTLLRFSTSQNEDEFTVLASGIGTIPLDVTAQGDFDVFPGTIWVCNYAGDNITVLDPVDFSVGVCDLSNSDQDADGDGYTNLDEEENDTDPCNPAHLPSDFDGDLVSDLLDTDDDNDQIPDIDDYFPLDATNGNATPFPHRLDFDNENDGGIRGWGFTGIMSDGINLYNNLFDPTQMTVGGAGLKFTIDEIGDGTSLGLINNQKNAFQFGIDIPGEEALFQVSCRIQGPFSNLTTFKNQAYGLYVGRGDQDNYISLEINANQGVPAFRIVSEEESSPEISTIELSSPLTEVLDLQMIFDNGNQSVHLNYSDNGENFIRIGSIDLPSFINEDPIAVGIFGSSGDLDESFTATWDYIEVKSFQNQLLGSWAYQQSTNEPLARHENSFVQVGDKFVSLGGRGIKSVSIYDTQSNTWNQGSSPPIELHHFQAVEVSGLVYVAGALTGAFPNETPVDNIYIYDVQSDQWYEGPSISRPRGAAGSVVIGDYLYLISGIQNGHVSGWVNWVDRFDLRSNEWEVLSDIPNARDHFFAAHHDNKIYVAGGRRSGQESYFAPTIMEVDIFDFEKNEWSTLPDESNLPTGRAGAFGGIVYDQLIVAGGEDETEAKSATEALDLNTLTWRSLATLQDSRHGTQAIVNNNSLYVANGSGDQGGSPELTSMEVLSFLGRQDIASSPFDPVVMTISDTIINIDPFSQDRIQVSISNLSETNDARFIRLTSSEGIGITLENEELPLLIPASETRNVIFILSYSNDNAHHGSIELDYSGLVLSHTLDIFRSQKNPSEHNIDLGGDGGWSSDNQLFSPGITFLELGEQVKSSAEREIPFGTGIRGSDLELELEIEKGLYQLEIYADTIGLGQQIIADVRVESSPEILGWELNPNNELNEFSKSKRAFIEDGEFNLFVDSEDFILSGISYRKIPPLQTFVEVDEDQSVLIENSTLLSQTQMTDHEPISFQVIDLPVKGSLMINGLAANAQNVFSTDTTIVHFVTFADKKGADKLSYLVMAGDSIVAHYEMKVTINASRDPISLKPDAPAEFSIKQNQKLSIPYYTIINNPDNLIPEVDLSNSKLSEWLSVRLTKLEGTPTNDNVGRYNTIIRFSDDVGNQVAHSALIEVLNVNDPPVLIREFDDMSIMQDTILIIEIAPSDFMDIDEGDEIELDLIGLENDVSGWVSIEGLKIVFSPGIDQIGTHRLQLAIVDLEGARDTQDFSVEVLEAPIPEEEEQVDDNNEDEETTDEDEETVDDEENEEDDNDEENVEDENSEDEDQEEDTEPDEEENPIEEEVIEEPNLIPVFTSITLDAFNGETLTIGQDLISVAFTDEDSLDDKALEFIRLPDHGFLMNADATIIEGVVYLLSNLTDLEYAPFESKTIVDSVYLRPYDGEDYGELSYIIINQVSDTAEVVLGINQNNNGYLLYPNPALASVTLKSPLEIIGSAKAWILKPDGKLVGEMSIDEEFKEIDLSNFDPGVYIILIRNNHGITALKFIKQD